MKGTSVLLPVYVDCPPNQAPPMAIRAWQHMVCAYIYFLSLSPFFSFEVSCTPFPRCCGIPLHRRSVSYTQRASINKAARSSLISQLPFTITTRTIYHSPHSLNYLVRQQRGATDLSHVAKLYKSLYPCQYFQVNSIDIVLYTTE